MSALCQCLLVNGQKQAPKPASCLRMRSSTPAVFTSKGTEFTSPDFVLHFGACLLATFQFLQPRLASRVRSATNPVRTRPESRAPKFKENCFDVVVGQRVC